MERQGMLTFAAVTRWSRGYDVGVAQSRTLRAEELGPSARTETPSPPRGRRTAPVTPSGHPSVVVAPPVVVVSVWLGL